MYRKNSHRSSKDTIIDLLFIVAGCFSCGFASIFVMIPNGLTGGGITGVSRIIMHFLPINFSFIYYALSIIVMLAALAVLGKKEVKNIIIVVFVYPVVLFFLEQFDFVLVQDDIILAVIYSAFLEGFGTGLVLYRGSSFGGTDTISKIIKRLFLPHIDVSKILLMLNAIVILGNAFVYGREIALYALVSIVISSKAIDFVLFGLETKTVKMEIISAEYRNIGDYIMNDIGRGATIDEIIGAYTGIKRKRLVVFCTPRESMLIQQYVSRLDEKALISTLHVDSMWGSGFRKHVD